MIDLMSCKITIKIIKSQDIKSTSIRSLAYPWGYLTIGDNYAFIRGLDDLLGAAGAICLTSNAPSLCRNEYGPLASTTPRTAKEIK